MSDCIDILRSIGATCASLNQVGGVDKRVWVTQLNQIESYTFDSDGYINSLVTKEIGITNYQYQLAKIVGKKNTHSGTYEGIVGDNVNILKQTAILKIYTDSPSDRDKVIDLFDARELVVFFENANGFIEVYGLDKGLDGSALSGGTGVALQDDTVVTITLSGDQNKLPYYFLHGGSLATSIDYLDNIGFSPIYLIQSYTAGTSTIDFTNNGGDDWNIDFKIDPISTQPIGLVIDSYDFNAFFWSAGTDTEIEVDSKTADYTLNTSGNGAGVYQIDQNYLDSNGDVLFTVLRFIKVDGSGNILADYEYLGAVVSSVNGLNMTVTAEVNEVNCTNTIQYYAFDEENPTQTLLIGSGLSDTLTLPIWAKFVTSITTLDATFTTDYPASPKALISITIN